MNRAKRFFFDDYGPTVLGFVLPLVGSIVLVVALVIGGVVWMSSASCAQLGEQTGYPTRYVGPIGPGCMIEIDGQWIPASKWIYNNGN